MQTGFCVEKVRLWFEKINKLLLLGGFLLREGATKKEKSFFDAKPLCFRSLPMLEKESVLFPLRFMIICDDMIRVLYPMTWDRLAGRREYKRFCIGDVGDTTVDMTVSINGDMNGDKVGIMFRLFGLSWDFGVNKRG